MAHCPAIAEPRLLHMPPRQKTRAHARTFFSEKTRLMLIPFEIRDVRNWDDPDDDVLIQQLPDATDNDAKLDDFWKAAADKNIAWIVAHRDDDSDDSDKPMMPQLEIKFPGAPDGVQVKWKFKCTYDRGNGLQKSYNQSRDTIIIDKTGSPMPANQPWKLHQEQEWQSDFFGGKCVLTYQLVNSDAAPLTAETTVRFEIAGKNPDQDRAKNFFATKVQEINPALWFSYSVAKQESQGYAGSDHYYYNQFFARYRPMRKNQSGNLVPYAGSDWIGFWPGFPTYNKDDDGPGGYGIFQITQDNVNRKVIWNWQDNSTAGVQELNQWRSEAETWYAALVNTWGEPPANWVPPVPSGEPAVSSNKGLSSTDAENIVRYNGPKGMGDGRDVVLTMPGGKKRKFKASVWTHDKDGWHFHDNVNHYVYRVVEHIDPDSSSNK